MVERVGANGTDGRPHVRLRSESLSDSYLFPSEYKKVEGWRHCVYVGHRSKLPEPHWAKTVFAVERVGGGSAAVRFESVRFPGCFLFPSEIHKKEGWRHCVFVGHRSKLPEPHWKKTAFLVEGAGDGGDDGAAAVATPPPQKLGDIGSAPPPFLRASGGSLEPLPDTCEPSAIDVHIGKYKVYKNEDMNSIVAVQTMARGADGSLSYEYKSFRITDVATRAFISDHGVKGTVQPNGSIVWEHGYTSVPLPALSKEEQLQIEVRGGGGGGGDPLADSARVRLRSEHFRDTLVFPSDTLKEEGWRHCVFAGNPSKIDRLAKPFFVVEVRRAHLVAYGSSRGTQISFSHD